MQSRKALELILDGYLKTAVPVEEIAEPTDTCLTCNTEDSVKLTCSSAGCKRKRTKECATEMCFQCCFALKTPCQAHFRMRKKREEEDKYIEEGLRSTKKKTSFYHYEEKFMKSDQTIVIWCLQDFLARKEWSADTMAQYQRQQRTLDLLRRRHSQNSQLNSTDTASSIAASSPRAGSKSSTKAVSVASAASVALGDSKEESKSRRPSAGSKRSREEANETEENKETPVQSPAGKRGRSANCNTPSSATSATGLSAGEVKRGVKSTGKKLSKAARRFQKVQEVWRRQLNLSV